MSATGNRDGFTLLELLVALAIMALAAGIAFPALGRRLARNGAATARGEITLALTEARADAIARGVPTRLSLDGRALVSSAGRPPVDLPPDVGVRWPDRGFVFFADGSAQGGAGEIATDRATDRFDVDTGGRLAFAS